MPSRVPCPSRHKASPVPQALFSISVNSPVDPRPSFAARLLSQANHINYLHTHQGVQLTSSNLSPHDCFAVESYDTDTYQYVDLRHFPSGAVVDTLPQGYRIRPPGILPVMDYRPADGIFAYTLHAEFDVEVHGIEHSIRLVRFPETSRDRGIVSGALRNSVVYGLSLAPVGLKVAATESGVTCVYGARDGAQRLLQRASLPHPDHSPGCVTRFFDKNDVVAGTRAGNVFRWDLRLRGNNPVWSVNAASRNGKVHDMHVSGRTPEVYISVAGDRTSNLGVWDMRMSGAREPQRMFNTWGRWCDSVAFDVDESGTGGLLAAGGSDCKVSLWDCKRGGEPVEQISFGTERPQRVKFQGWDGKGKCGMPGMVVETEIHGYVFEIGERVNQR